MRKKKTTRIKRLRANEVELVAEMQRNIDAYEEHIILLCGMIQKKDTSVKWLLRGTPLDEFMSRTWVYVMDSIKNEKENSNEGTGGDK